MKTNLPKERYSQAGPVAPTVMVTCVDARGRPNIITLGMYMPISHDPPQVVIGVSPKRYSHDLIRDQGEFIVNSPGIGLAEKMHICGTKSGRDVDKFKEAGLTPGPARKVRPPLIQECYGHIECEVVNMVTCGDHTLFVGEVVAASIDEDCLRDGKLNLSAARPIAQKNWDYRTLSEK
ncbi:MAG: flavin reductase family protein [Candidatus Bathyarchaeota archaeon]|nr:flavin reductase family protein [Candidatus Bathyarchaeota archaeon]